MLTEMMLNILFISDITMVVPEDKESIWFSVTQCIGLARPGRIGAT
jgi:hypothetical protein